MADGETVADKIADIAASKAAIAAAIAAKGVAVPSGAKLAELAPLVGQISGGAGGAEDTCVLDRDTMRELVIPEGVTNIGNYAFYKCGNLGFLTLPNGLETIGNYAFYDIAPRKAIVIPEGVKTIGDKAFNTTSQYLKSYGGELHLPSTLESIGYQAFGGFGMLRIPVKCFANGTKEKFKGLLSASGPYMGVYISLVVICTDGVFKYEGTDESIVDDDDYVYGEMSASTSGNSVTFDIQGFGFTWDDTKDDEGFFWTAHAGEEETKVTQVEVLDPGRHVVVTVSDMGTSGGAPGSLSFSRRTSEGVLERAWGKTFYH